MTTSPSPQPPRPPAPPPAGSDPQLLAVGLSGSETATGATRSSWTPPAVADLAGVFPQLVVEELLGSGAMGAVYRARQTHLERTVALKLLPAELGRDPAFVERFRREGRALARLNHPHIVTLFDFGQAGDWLYLVMELVDGASLRDALRTGAFTPLEALRLVPQLCEALDYAHQQGVVHRDLKPENILVDSQGRLKIADFGLAKLNGDVSGGSLTSVGQTIGTIAYMAPEQVTGARSVDHRADVYALGVILYEMLTGQLPLGRFQPPSRQVQVDVRVDEVVLRALEREPEQRWQKAGDVQQAMHDIAATPGTVPPAADPPPAPQGGMSWYGSSAFGKSLLTLAVLGGVAALLLWSGTALLLSIPCFLLAWIAVWLFLDADSPPLRGKPGIAEWSDLRHLRRSATDRQLAGICGGLGRYTPLPTWLWRSLFVIFTLCSGVGLVAYLVLWIAMPMDPAAPPFRRARFVLICALVAILVFIAIVILFQHHVWTSPGRLQWHLVPASDG